MRKVLALGCTSLAIFGLVGCGGSGEKKEAAKDSGKKVQIEYWHVAAESFGGGTVKESGYVQRPDAESAGRHGFRQKP